LFELAPEEELKTQITVDIKDHVTFDKLIVNHQNYDKNNIYRDDHDDQNRNLDDEANDLVVDSG